MDKARLVRLKDRAALFRPLFSVRDDCILYKPRRLSLVVPNDPCVEVVYEADCPTFCVDRSFYQVCIVEDVT